MNNFRYHKCDIDPCHTDDSPSRDVSEEKEEVENNYTCDTFAWVELV